MTNWALISKSSSPRNSLKESRRVTNRSSSRRGSGMTQCIPPTAIEKIHDCGALVRLMESKIATHQ